MTTYEEAKQLARERYGPDVEIQEVGGPNGPTCSIFASGHQRVPVWTGKSWDEFRSIIEGSR